jgi:hypothetical protein
MAWYVGADGTSSMNLLPMACEFRSTWTVTLHVAVQNGNTCHETLNERACDENNTRLSW